MTTPAKVWLPDLPPQEDWTVENLRDWAARCATIARSAGFEEGAKLVLDRVEVHTAPCAYAAGWLNGVRAAERPDLIEALNVVAVKAEYLQKRDKALREILG